MSTINERIELIIKEFKMNNNSFSKAIGLSASTSINNITGGRKSKPSYELIESIVTTFPKINVEWLIIGTGGMYKSDKKPRDYSEFNEHEAFYSAKTVTNEIIEMQRLRIEGLKLLIEAKDELIKELRKQLDNK